MNGSICFTVFSLENQIEIHLLCHALAAGNVFGLAEMEQFFYRNAIGALGQIVKDKRAVLPRDRSWPARSLRRCMAASRSAHRHKAVLCG